MVFVESVVPPSSSRKGDPINKPSRFKALSNAILANFHLSTLLLIGACLQAGLVLLLPNIYALTPAVALLLFRVFDTALITAGIKSNPYLKGAIKNRVTTIIPDKNGEPSEPGQEKIAVFHLGAKSNHPLGLLAPKFSTVGDYMGEMIRDLETESNQDNGFLGQSVSTRQDANGATEYLFLSYWRTMEDVHAFAHRPIHRRAWQWWERSFKSIPHIGIMHELFEADKSMWEAVYLNFQPTMLGATSFLKKPNGKIEAGEVPAQWLSPLVDATKGALRTSRGRRGVTKAHGEREASVMY